MGCYTTSQASRQPSSTCRTCDKSSKTSPSGRKLVESKCSSRTLVLLKRVPAVRGGSTPARGHRAPAALLGGDRAWWGKREASSLSVGGGSSHELYDEPHIRTPMGMLKTGGVAVLLLGWNYLG